MIYRPQYESSYIYSSRVLNEEDYDPLYCFSKVLPYLYLYNYISATFYIGWKQRVVKKVVLKIPIILQFCLTCFHSNETYLIAANL